MAIPTRENPRKKPDPYPTLYRLNEEGDIEKLELEKPKTPSGGFKKNEQPKIDYDAKKRQKDYPFKSFEEAVGAQKKFTFDNTKKQISKLQSQYDEELSKNKTYNTLAEQIANLSRGGENYYMGGSPYFNEMTGQATGQPNSGGAQVMSAQNAYGSSNLANKLNFQVSDDDILNDYNTSKLGRLNSVVDRGNTQIAGIQQRLDSAQKLLDQLPAGDARRDSSQVYVNQLKSDLKSVQGAVTDATQQIKNFSPLTVESPQAAREITSFREFLQLPEERATQQLRQIDPESYRTAVGLGRQYREMATRPIGETTTPETEQLRRTIEDEALNQLRLGSTIGAEERRGYEQSIRGAQTARGNISGLGPAVQEAAQIGAAGEQRKLARYGAAQSFLGSGETSGAAKARDLLLREGIQQNRLGAASGFIAGGPSIYNLANQRVGQQQGAMQGYIQANQSLPGGFNQQASTAAPFYQAVDQNIPVALTQAFNDLYRSQSNYLASTYGAQVAAQASSNNANSIPNYLNAGASLIGNVAPKGLMAAPVFCWVAREVYGEDNPKWLQFREWMLTKASNNLRNFYTEYGERIAESIRNKPKIKSIIRKWMDSKIG